MDDFIERFKSLGDATRLRIIRLLCEARGYLCVCEIMDVIEDSHSNVSRHLKILRIAKLVKEKKEGKWSYYSLANPESAFHRNLLQAVRNIPGEYFTHDCERLKLRLSLRKDGKCLDGLRSGKWLAAVKLLKTKDINYRDKNLKRNRG